MPRAILALAAAQGIFFSVITASQSLAQFNEGDLVQAEDGSLYVSQGGQLHAIQATQRYRSS